MTKQTRPSRESRLAEHSLRLATAKLEPTGDRTPAGKLHPHRRTVSGELYDCIFVFFTIFQKHIAQQKIVKLYQLPSFEMVVALQPPFRPYRHLQRQ
jgi:hypothetical protein